MRPELASGLHIATGFHAGSAQNKDVLVDVPDRGDRIGDDARVGAGDADVAADEAWRLHGDGRRGELGEALGFGDGIGTAQRPQSSAAGGRQAALEVGGLQFVLGVVAKGSDGARFARHGGRDEARAGAGSKTIDVLGHQGNGAAEAGEAGELRDGRGQRGASDGGAGIQKGAGARPGRLGVHLGVDDDARELHGRAEGRPGHQGFDRTPCGSGVVSANLVASFLTLLPAMAILFWVLNRYEGYFEQNRLFFALTLGIFLGLGVRFLEVRFFQFESELALQATGLIGSAIYTVIGYSVLEAMANQMALGFRKFRVRKDTAYYGASLGVGFGAMWSLQLATITLQPYTEPALLLSVATAAKVVEVLLTSAGLVLAHAGAATWIGKGSGEGKLWQGAGIGALWLMPALAVYWFIIRESQGLLPAVVLFVYGAVCMVQAQKRVLDTLVPQEIREMVRRARRREQRKAE